MRPNNRPLIATLLSLLLLFSSGTPAAAVAAAVYTVPVAASFSTAVPANRASVIALQGSDAEGTSLVYATTSTPSHGALSSLNTATGYVVYTPTAGYTGSDSFNYTVTSGGETGAAGTVTLSVTSAKTTVTDTITDPGGSPRSGKVTFILTQATTTPAGISPVGASVSAALNGSGAFTVQVYPSRSMSPAAYYQVWFNDATTLRQELLGVYDIPAATSTVSLSATKVTDTNLAQRYTFMSAAAAGALADTVSSGLSTTLLGSSTTGRLQKKGGSGLADSLVSESGSTATVAGNAAVTGNLSVTGAITGNGAGITGLTGATGGVSNTGSTTIRADSDNDSVGVIDLQAKNGVTGLRVNNDGTVSVGGQVITPPYNVKTYGAQGDGTTLGGCSVSSGAAALTCSSGFTAADASKVIVVPGAGAAGADLSTTISSYTSATQVTLAANASTTVSSKTVSYGTDDTAAIQSAISAAVAAGGGSVYVPPGFYVVTTSGSPLRALYVGGHNVTLYGVKGKSRIANASATGDTLQIGTAGGSADADDCAVTGLVFQPAVTRTSGNEIFAPAFHNLSFRDLKLKGFYRGFYLGSALGSVDVHMSGVFAEDFFQFAFMVRMIQGEFKGIFADGLRGDTVNLQIDGYCEGLQFISCIFISNYSGTKTNSYMLLTSNTVVSRPSQFVYFFGCYFDFGNYGVVAQNAYSYSFVDCWFKGATDSGILLDSTAHDFSFFGCDFFNSGTAGVYINGSSGHRLVGNTILNNGTAGVNTGVRLTGTAAGIVITSNRIGMSGTPRISDGGAGSQDYGVTIDATAVSFIVKDNDCRGNATGAVSNGAGTSSVKVVADNLF